MRNNRKIIVFIAISIFIQIIILFLFNNFYLIRNKAYVETIKYGDFNGLQVPQNAKSIKVSYDGKYVGYLLNEKLKVFSMENAKEIIISDTEETTSFFRWLPDRDLIIYSKVHTDTSTKSLEIKTVDVSSGIERSYPQIRNISSKSEIIGIELSPLTNIVYIKVKMNEYEMDIFKYDIMDNLKYVMTLPLETIIKEMNFKDILVYQKKSDSIIIRDGLNGNSEKITLEKDGVLLGTDYEDNIYIGEFDEGKNINKILIKKENGKDNYDWTHILLKKSFEYQNIYITSKGDIVCLDGESVYIPNKDKEIKFSGICEDIHNNYVIIKNNNFIITQQFEP